jgi:hypothetical protein
MSHAGQKIRTGLVESSLECMVPSSIRHQCCFG